MFKNLFLSYCDAPEPWQVGLQDPATPVMEGMISFHNYLMFFLVTVVVFVIWMLYSAYNSRSNPFLPSRFSHSSVLEITWTIIPAIILILIALPSFTLLYSLDELMDPTITIKVIGHQWYWSYEYSDYLVNSNSAINYDSYILSEDVLVDTLPGGFRLLETDYRVLVPYQTHIRLLVTSSDVLHSWAVPSFGIKIDACPGRLSQVSFFAKRLGLFFGQCSEICGINHGFMPISVSVINFEEYFTWVICKLDDTN